jgi:hypothetical protein
MLSRISLMIVCPDSLADICCCEGSAWHCTNRETGNYLGLSSHEAI